MSNTPTSGNGSIFSNGYAMSQNAALKQNAMNNTIGGKRIRTKDKKRRPMYNGGAQTVVQPIHASYPNNGIQGLNTDLTRVSAQQQSDSQFDGNVAKTGGSRRRRRTNRRKTNRRKTNRRRRSLRKSRRHM